MEAVTQLMQEVLHSVVLQMQGTMFHYSAHKRQKTQKQPSESDCKALCYELKVYG